MSDKIQAAAHSLYEQQFGDLPAQVSFAPGRVNLLGEHTDYNGGLVLPVTLPMGISVALGPGGGAGNVAIASGARGELELRQLGASAQDHWSDYVLGALDLGGASAKQGIRVAIANDLPVGSGLSSSAALIVAVLRALNALDGIKGDPVETALLARRVENEFVGLPCGIMDQYAVSVGRPGHALFLDTLHLTTQSVALPQRHRFAVVHSGAAHKLTDDGYTIRVAETQAACKALGVENLSALSLADLDKLPDLRPPLAARTRHVVTENQRVRDAVAALRAGDMAALGAAMIASHQSQRDDYEVSVPEVDALVEAAIEAGAIGARLTGGGFGGSVVALVAEADLPRWQAQVAAARPQTRLLAVC